MSNIGWWNTHDGTWPSSEDETSMEWARQLWEQKRPLSAIAAETGIPVSELCKNLLGLQSARAPLMDTTPRQDW